MRFVALNKTICQSLQVNTQAILFRFKEYAQTEIFFILYDKKNIYEKVKNECIYNKAHIVKDIVGY